MPKRKDQGARKIFSIEESLVRRAHEVIWERSVDHFYTDHGIGHSERVCQFAEALSKPYNPTPYERHLLRQAAYLHDIGMQFDFWGTQASSSGTIAKSLGLPGPPLGADQVRKRHVELGNRLVKAELAGRRDWSAIPAFSSDSHDARNALHQASLVAFAHSKGDVWESFRHPNPTLNQRPDPYGDNLRLRLLAGIFRLADELDGNRLRVPRIDQIFDSSLPDESRRHWLACFFVESVVIERGVGTGLRVRVFWRVPVGGDHIVKQAIREFLRERRLLRINETIAEIAGMYEEGGEGGFRTHIEVVGLQDEPSEFPMEVSDRLRSLLDIDQRGELHVGFRGGVEYLEDEEEIGEIEESSEELDKWFYSNHRLGHFVLARGFHTDTLVQCRSWVSNRSLLRAVSNRIVSELEKGRSPDLVVGVGTSAIPVAVETALLLGCRVSFTFGELPPQAADDLPRHPVWEVNPVLDGSEEHVLIIDDIISFGETASQVIEGFWETARVRYNRTFSVTHCALLRLGHEPLIKLPNVRYIFLCEVPGVRYWRSEADCEQCSQGIPLVREWEV